MRLTRDLSLLRPCRQIGLKPSRELRAANELVDPDARAHHAETSEDDRDPVGLARIDRLKADRVHSVFLTCP